jgi:23S rRNA pseudouridine2605 synthase
MIGGSDELQAGATRVQKLLSQWGVASRRQAEELILAGRVRVNGQPATLGQKADPERDQIEVNGQVLQPQNRPAPLYILLHKPAGVVTTCADPQQRRTVMELLPTQLRQRQGLHPVGRLDCNSTGALLLTNDGNLTEQLTHPRHLIAKTYRVGVKGNPDEAVLQRWRDGVTLAGRITLPASVQVLERTDSPGVTHLEVILHEGRNRQIRRVADLLGFPVVYLHRMSIGSVQLQPPGQPELAPGAYRPLSKAELASLTELLECP